MGDRAEKVEAASGGGGLFSAITTGFRSLGSAVHKSVNGLLGYEGLEVINPEGGTEDAEAEAAKGRWNQEDRDGHWKMMQKYIGSDVTSMVTLPVIIFEPMTMLQKMAELMEYSHLLNLADECEDPYMRLVYTSSWAISVYYAYQRTWKPFNPILGETYEMVNHNGVTFLAEQVSHHPPIAAGHAENDHFTYDITSKVKTKFLGNSVEIYPVGRTRVTLKKSGVVLDLVPPLTKVNNLIFGRTWIDSPGDMVMTNLTTGDKVVMYFQPCGWFGAGRYEVDGYVYNAAEEPKMLMTGKWNESISYQPCDLEGEPLPGTELKEVWRVAAAPENDKYQYTYFAHKINSFDTAPKKLLASDSRLRPDRYALEKGDMGKSSAEKSRLEDLQRAEKRSREAKGDKFTPRWFNMTDEIVPTPWSDLEVYEFNGKYNEHKAVVESSCSGGEPDIALERAVAVPEVERGPEHALAKFSGYMQLGDTYSMLGRVDQSIDCYTKGLQIQMEALGEMDPRVAETCRYLAEAHVQAMQFDEADKLCKKTLDIHREHSAPASPEEAADRRLMALIAEAKGDFEAALEHLVLASMAMIANSQETEVAAIDVSIGNTYLSLGRFDEAIFSYQKALTVFKSAKGDNHPSVALVFVRLAELYYKTGKLRESRSYCENALRIYAKPVPGTAPEDIAGGLMEISGIYEAMEETEEALKLLQKALKLLEDVPGQWSTVAGIEAQMGVIFYMAGKYVESRNSFESAVAKLRASGERKSAFFGVVLNQMGLACVQLFKIDEAAELFEEARGILEQECGACHQDTLGVYSNLAATYDAMGRVEDAIEILEYVLKVREEKLGTANPDVDEEKRRLAELLKEAGRARNKKAKSLENLIVNTSQRMKEVTKRWSGLGFKSEKR